MMGRHGSLLCSDLLYMSRMIFSLASMLSYGLQHLTWKPIVESFVPRHGVQPVKCGSQKTLPPQTMKNLWGVEDHDQLPNHWTVSRVVISISKESPKCVNTLNSSWKGTKREHFLFPQRQNGNSQSWVSTLVSTQRVQPSLRENNLATSNKMTEPWTLTSENSLHEHNCVCMKWCMQKTQALQHCKIWADVGTGQLPVAG